MKYYRLYDTQTGRYMATGYNTTSPAELCDHYQSYKSNDWDNNDEEDNMHKIWEALSEKEKFSFIRQDEFDIEESDKPFEEEEEEPFDLDKVPQALLDKYDGAADKQD